MTMLSPTHDAARGARRASVVTLTPAPAIDRVYLLEDVVLGEVNRARVISEELAGKGVNVSRVLLAAGIPTRMVLPWSGRADLLPPEAVAVPSSYPTRLHTVVIDRSGATTNINEFAPELSAAEWELLCESAMAGIHELGADWLLVGGSIPSSADTVVLRGLFAAAREAGARVCIDTSGSALSRILDDAGELIDLVKPNLSELGEATGASLRTRADVVDAAQQLRGTGVGRVLASVGGDGMVHVDADGARWARSRPVEVVNSTGAGDAALAGFLSATPRGPGSGLTSALRTAVSWGQAAVRCTTAVPDASTLSLIDVAVEAVDRHALLHDLPRSRTSGPLKGASS